MPLKIVPPADRPKGNFVCTWCAGTFATRSALLTHRILHPECAKNQSISNQTQTKYNYPGQAKTEPGEEILRRVRSGNCDHTTTQNITDADGEVIGLQCLYCYSYLEVIEEHTDPQAVDDGNPVDTQ